MHLIDVLLGLLGLGDLPGVGQSRSARFERIGCLVGLAVILPLVVLAAIVELIPD